MAEKKKGFAIPILRRKPDGQNTVVFADAKTGEIVDPKDYQILDQYTAHLMELGLAPEPDEEMDAKSEEEKKDEANLKRGRNDSGDYYEGVSKGSKSKAAPREMANNYGYIDKPGFMGLANALPGPVGLVGKAANAAINLNNKAAVDQAREMLGMSKGPGFISGALKDNKGYVGDVSYNGVTSPVGFEATDTLGRTTLTPNEARMRQQLSQNFREAEDVEKAQSVAQFKSENPQTFSPTAKAIAGTVAKGAIQGALGGNIMGGVLGSLVNSVKDYGIGVAADAIGDAFKKDTPKTKTATQVSQAGTQGHRGLGNLSPSFNEGISYTHPERGPVTAGLSQRTVDVLNSLAGTPGSGLKVTSAFRGQVNPKTGKTINEEIGGAKNSLHLTGDALDLSTRDLNDQQKRDLVERAVMSGAMEIGTYPDQSLHIASLQRMSPTMNVNGVEVAQPTGGVTAMHARSRHNYNNAPEWFRDGLEVSRLAPTPTARPEYSAPVGARNEAVANVDLSRYGSFDEATKMRMAQTLAGEIDQRFTDLSTDVGRNEAFGVLSTMENRANRYGTINDAIKAKDQYSTWNNQEAADTALANYYNNAAQFDNLVSEYAANPSLNRGFTSYYNPSIANPGWGPSMVETEDIGPHRFGKLSEYSSFGKNFGQTQMTDVTQQTTGFNKTPAGLGAMASASGTIGIGSGMNTKANLGGFSSSVSGENANRNNFSSSPSSKSESSYERSKDSGFSSGSSGSKGTSSSASSGGSKSSISSGSSKSSTSTKSTYDKSKDSGFGSATKTSSSPHNKGDSKTSSGKLGGRV